MEVDSVSSTYTPPPAPVQNEPAPAAEEIPASEVPVEAPNTSVNIDIIA